MLFWTMVKESLRLAITALRHKEWEKAQIILSWLIEEIMQVAKEMLRDLYKRAVRR